MTRLYVSPPVAGVANVGTEPVPGRTEYVRADRLNEAVEIMRGLANAYECICEDTGNHYHTSPASYYAHARAFLAKESDQ